MQVNSYLNFNGRCEAAFKFYEQCLGGRIVCMMTHGESPMRDQTPEDWRGAILHAKFVVGDNILLGSDVPQDHYELPRGFFVSLQFDDPAEADRVFQVLSHGGTVKMPLQQTFWAVRFGMLVDQFGIPWMVNCENAELDSAEL